MSQIYSLYSDVNLTMVMSRTITPLEMFFEGEDKIPRTINLGINIKANPFFEIYKMSSTIKNSKNIFLFI